MFGKQKKKQKMEPLTLLELAGIIEECSKNVLNEVKLDCIILKLDELTQLCGEILLRDLRGAFKSFQDYLACGESSTKWQILGRVEEGFLRNTGLDPKGHIGSVKSADIIALSYYGLSFIYAARGEGNIAERYIFRMFESSSRLARQELSPAVFESLIKPHCKKCYDTHQYKLRRQAKAGDYIKQASRGVYGGIVGLGGLLVAFVHPTGRVVAREAAKHAERVWNEGANAKEWKSTEEIKEELENSLDIRSSEVAKDFLAEKLKYKEFFSVNK